MYRPGDRFDRDNPVTPRDMKSHGRALQLNRWYHRRGPWRSILFQIAHCCSAGRLIAQEAGRNSINFANKFIILFDRVIYICWSVRETTCYSISLFFSFLCSFILFTLLLLWVDYYCLICIRLKRGVDNLLLDFFVLLLYLLLLQISSSYLY